MFGPPTEQRFKPISCCLNPPLSCLSAANWNLAKFDFFLSFQWHILNIGIRGWCILLLLLPLLLLDVPDPRDVLGNDAPELVRTWQVEIFLLPIKTGRGIQKNQDNKASYKFMTK